MLTDTQRDRIEVVLVSPRNPLNIGAAARAMANFGFARLMTRDLSDSIDANALSRPETWYACVRNGTQYERHT
ncbi:MAG: hypothetical protein WDM87_17910 [Terracidiphilus sp.]